MFDQQHILQSQTECAGMAMIPDCPPSVITLTTLQNVPITPPDVYQGWSPAKTIKTTCSLTPLQAEGKVVFFLTFFIPTRSGLS